MQFQPVDLPVLYFGTPVALVSSLNCDGTTNLSPISSYWALDQTFMLGLGTAGQCYRNLQHEGGLVVNLPGAALWRNVEAIAATTGAKEMPQYKRDMGYRYEADKFRLGELTTMASELVKPDRVAECPIQIEAEAVKFIPIGGDAPMAAVEVRVLRVHADKQVLQTGGRRIDLERWQPLYYVFQHYFTLGDRLGANFRA